MKAGQVQDTGLPPDQLMGAVHYYNTGLNPPGGEHVKGPVFGGIQYPFGTVGVQSGHGRWWIAKPQDFLRCALTGIPGIPYNDPDRPLIEYAVQQLIHSWGVLKVDWKRYAEEGDDYFGDLAIEGQNFIIDTIQERVVDQMAKDNAYRKAQRLQERGYQPYEELLVVLADALRKKLKKQAGLKQEEAKKAIESIAEATDPIVDLEKLGGNALKKRVKEIAQARGVEVDPKMATWKKDDILSYARKMLGETAAAREAGGETEDPSGAGAAGEGSEGQGDGGTAPKE